MRTQGSPASEFEQLAMIGNASAHSFPRINIDALPDELLSRIFTIGCEKNLHIPAATQGLDFASVLSDDPFAEGEASDSVLPVGDGIRKAKRFTQFVMLVCRRWFSIAITPSNSQLWVVKIALYSSQSDDFASNFTLFHSALRNSRGADLEIRLSFSSECHPLVIHALSQLGQYRSQIRGLMFQAYSVPLLSCIYNFLLNLDGASRLEWVRIKAFTAFRHRGLGHHFNETSSLHPFLANNGIGSFHFPSLVHFVAVMDEMPGPVFLLPTGPIIEYLAIWNLPKTGILRWSEFVETLKTATELKNLSMDLIMMEEMPNLESLSSVRREAMRSLTEMQVSVSPVDLFTLFSLFDFPTLNWLQVIYTIKDGVRKIRDVPELIVELPLLKRLTWHSYISSAVPTFHAVHAPRLESLDLALSQPSTPQAIAKQVAFISIPAIVQISCSSYRSGCAVLAACAGFEAIEHLCFSPLPGLDDAVAVPEEPLHLPNLTRLSFRTYGWTEIEKFLSRLAMPPLTRVEHFVRSAAVPSQVIIPPLIDNGGSLVARIREIEIWNVYPEQLQDHAMMNLERVTIVEPNVPPDHLMMTFILHCLQVICPMSFPQRPALTALTVKFLHPVVDAELVEVEEALMKTYQIRCDGGAPLTRVTIDSPSRHKELRIGSDGTAKFVESGKEADH